MPDRPIEELERELGELPQDEPLARDIGERLLEELGWRIHSRPVDEAEELLGEWASVPQRYPSPISDAEIEARLKVLRSDGTGEILTCHQARGMRDPGMAEARAKDVMEAFRQLAGDFTLTGWVFNDERSVRIHWSFHENALTPGLLLDFAQAEAALRDPGVD